MKTTIILICLIFSICCGCFAQSKYNLNADSAILHKSLQIGLGEVGTIERSNRNDGEVVKYLKPFGLPEGTPYCAAGQYYCFLLASNYNTKRIPIAKTALAQGVFNAAKISGQKTKYCPEVNDLVIWRYGSSNSSKKSIKGHIERIIEVLDDG